MADNFFKIKKGMNLGSQASDPSNPAEGDFYTNSGTNQVRIYVGGVWRSVVADTGTARLEDKNLVDSSTAIIDAVDATKQIKFNAGGTTGTSTTITGAQTANRVLTLPDATDTLVSQVAAQTISNKTLTDLATFVVAETDPTSRLKFEIGGDTGLTTTLRTNSTLPHTIDMPNATTTLVGRDTVDALSNKTQIDVDNIRLDGNTISSTNSNGDVNVTANGTGKLKVESGAGKGIDVQSAGAMPIGASVGANNITIGAGTSTVVIPGNLQVDGTTVTVNTTTLEVEDANILINNGGNDASSEGAGLTVERTSTNGSIIYKDASATKFALGAAGSEVDVVGTTSTQQLTNKDVDGGTASNTNRITLPKAATSTLSALTRKEGTIFYDTDQDKPVFDNGSTLIPIGSGSAGAVNLVTYDSTAQSTKADNSTAETSVGDWVAYADAAATTPVDMTGGSPNTTIARSTSSPLNGAANFLVTISSGASRQGEGVSLLCNIPLAYRGRNLQLTFPYAITGSVVEDDFKLYAYAVDGVSAGVITPYTSSKILGSSGAAVATFNVPTDCTQLRVGIHIARTSTGAATIKFDDVSLSPTVIPVGMAGSDWMPYTPTFSGIGTPASSNVIYRRVGSNIEVKGVVTAGTVTAAAFAVSLPSGLNAVTNTFATLIPGTLVTEYPSGDNDGIFALLPANESQNVAFTHNDLRNGLVPIPANALANNGQIYAFNFSVPIAGWSSNVQMADSSQFKISSYLASGTRVTGTPPTALGQYRSYLRNGAALTFGEASGTPTDLPSLANGIRLDSSTSYAAADSAGRPSRYDIFVGKNKSVKMEWYADPARTGFVTTDAYLVSANNSQGVFWNYDPTTGIVQVQPAITSNSTSNFSLGMTTSYTQTNTIYFDIVVSENALAVGIENRTPTIQRLTSGSGTYTTPAGAKYLRVRMVGGGGGGEGSNNGGTGGTGGDTTFGTSLLTAKGATGGSSRTGGAGGVAGTINSPAISVVNAPGGAGQAGGNAAYTFPEGSMGGNSYFGGGAAGTQVVILDGAANTGGGGNGVGGNANATARASGGGGGNYVEALIYTPNITYSYSVGTGGTGGTAGTNGFAGGAGGSGVIIVEEHYQ